MKSAKKFDLMNSISWKIKFRSHEIWPPDPESKINKLNLTYDTKNKFEHYELCIYREFFYNSIYAIHFKL